MSLFTNNQLIGIGVVGLVALVYLAKKGSEVVTAVNPLNDDNIFHTGANAVGEKITGEEGWTVGGAIWDFFKGDDFEERFKNNEGPR